MPKLSLTDFVDIVSCSGTPKASKISEVKARPSYAPAFDFYKILREAIVEIHQGGQPKRHLDFLMSAVTDAKKKSNYPDAISGYKKWWGHKTFTWFPPPRESYSQHGVEIVINPELGLLFNGQKHVIKLYFKSSPLSKLRVDIITELMAASLGPKCTSGEQFSVLDVRNAKIFSQAAAKPMIKAVIDAELAYVANIWPNV